MHLPVCRCARIIDIRSCLAKSLQEIVPVFFWFTVYCDLNIRVFTSEISAATKYFYNFYRSCDVLAFGAPARPEVILRKN